ncbi:dihydropyrimidinase [Lutimaribacter marinistellae]|uniref:Dihydropyrimidinase n=1 Tax=Lutimaribacter marinistellae TaxID=1820329 RepID=A0ABV7TEK4_9RHOB
MTTPAYDTVIRNGILGSDSGLAEGDIAIRDGRIAALGLGLASGLNEIDAQGRIVLPGGVDTHCHIEQMSGAGVMNADTFETATRSALWGGTTTTVSFAAQHPGQRIGTVLEAYRKLAKTGAMTDHAFHMIVADTSGENMSDLAHAIDGGNRSIKIFTTYDKVRLADAEILTTMRVAKEHGALVCVHAENDAMIREATARLIAEGRTAPRDHADSHPRLAELEAIERMCRLSELTGQRLMIFHVSTREGVEIIRAARARGVPVHAETCTHYLFQTRDILDRPDGAKFLCSPPQRDQVDQDALWTALGHDELELVTSDHAPYRMDETGKFLHGRDAPFNKIANGQPGLELRLPLLFDAMVSRGRLGLARFVEVTATAPARIFGLETKGAIAVGKDADLVLWNPEREHVLPEALHDNVGYNPFAGQRLKGHADIVLRRGETVIADGVLHAQPGSGRWLSMRQAG